mgnify:FL=1
MIVKVNQLLKEAGERHQAVLALDVFSMESILWAIEAAQREEYPIILMYYPGMIDSKMFVDISKRAAETATVSVGLIVDHGKDFPTLIDAMKNGLPSVMFDGSANSFEENIAQTKEIVRIAHQLGIDVEGELGHVGMTSDQKFFTNADTYTNVDQAVEFVRETGVDTLAVAIGNAHGNYPFEPKLDLDRLRELREALDLPLILHGGTGIPAEQVKAAIRIGVTKVNVGTSYGAAFYDAMKKVVDEGKITNYVPAKSVMKEVVIDFVRHWIQIVKAQ